MIIPKGTTCYGSQKGYYNFYYPNFDDKYETTLALEVNLLPWITFESFAAVKIESPENYLPLNIVWIKKPV